MSYLYRPRSTKWTLEGKIVPRGTPGAKKKVYTSSYWYGSYRDWQGVEQRVKLSERKEEAQRLLAALITQDDRRRLGQADPTQEQRRRPLDDHLREFREYLEAKGSTRSHICQMMNYLETILRETKTESIEQISESKVLAYLSGLKRGQELEPMPDKQKWLTKREVCLYTGLSFTALANVIRRRNLAGEGAGRRRRFPRATVEALRKEFGRGRGHGTINRYLTAAKSFASWLWRNHRLERNPLLSLSRFNPALDVRRKRRALSPEEFASLLSAAQRGKPWRGLSGPDRARLYLLAARSGFRERELASLTPESFDLKGGFIHLPALISKRRRAEKQPIGKDILAALMELIRDTKPGQPLWPGSWHERGAEMLRVDLREAGIPFETEEGVFDFHATRHLFISDLIASGVNPKEAQILARHSTIELTLGRYSHVQQEALRQAVERLGK